MEKGNYSAVTEFILAVLTKKPELQLPHLLLLEFYVIMVEGILGTVQFRTQLAHPVLFFQQFVLH
jgi:hypothetical protein